MGAGATLAKEPVWQQLLGKLLLRGSSGSSGATTIQQREGSRSTDVGISGTACSSYYTETYKATSVLSASPEHVDNDNT